MAWESTENQNHNGSQELQHQAPLADLSLPPHSMLQLMISNVLEKRVF